MPPACWKGRTTPSPETFRTWTVPETLRTGHAANIVRWRREASLRRTWERRPDLLGDALN